MKGAKRNVRPWKGKVKSIPKADREIDKRVSQIVLKMSGKFVQSGFGK